MTSENYENLAAVQQLVSDIALVERNHRVPGTERRENVVEHSFASMLIGWWALERLDLGLDRGKVYEYLMVHDFTERGLDRDFNAYRMASDHDAKAVYESAQLQALVDEFGNFHGLTERLTDYDGRIDDEAWFAETIEKMQAIILDQIDGWRAHRAIGAMYDDYVTHHQRVLERVYPPARMLLAEVIEYGRQTYYDQPL